MGADIGKHDDPRAELEDIKAQGMRGNEIIAAATARLAEYTRAGRWRELPEGYQTVAEFLAAEFPLMADLAIPQAPRRELVALMSAEATPQQAIAAALGVSQQTVSRDLGITNIGNSGTDREPAKRGPGRPRKPAASATQIAPQQDAPPTAPAEPEQAQDSAHADAPVVLEGPAVQQADSGGQDLPGPQPCPGCRSRDEHIADVEAERDLLAAELEEAHRRIAQLTRPAAPDGPDQGGPGIDPQESPEPPDGEQVQPGVPSGQERPCSRIDAVPVRVLIGGQAREYLACPAHLALFEAKHVMVEPVLPEAEGSAEQAAPDVLEFTLSCTCPVLAAEPVPA